MQAIVRKRFETESVQRLKAEVTRIDSGEVITTKPVLNDFLYTNTNPAATTTQDVTWDYDPVNATVTRETTSGTVTMARDVNTFSLYYANGSNVETASLVEVKQVQLSLRMLRLVAGTVTSEYVISAQFTMRAKSTAH